MKPGDRVTVGSGRKAHILVSLPPYGYFYGRLCWAGRVACFYGDEEVHPAPPEAPDCKLCAKKRPQR